MKPTSSRSVALLLVVVVFHCSLSAISPPLYILLRRYNDDGLYIASFLFTSDAHLQGRRRLVHRNKLIGNNTPCYTVACRRRNNTAPFRILHYILYKRIVIVSKCRVCCRRRRPGPEVINRTQTQAQVCAQV